MEHPFISDLSKFSTPELQDKINDLHKKLNYASRTNNQYLVGQVLMVIESYNNEYNKRMDEVYKKLNLSNSIQIINKHDS